jgi:hypothetical protein
VGSLILVVALAFVLTICVGFILKKQPKQVLKIFVRTDRVPKISPILLAQKCLDKALDLALSLFLNLSKNRTTFLELVQEADIYLFSEKVYTLSEH